MTAFLLALLLTGAGGITGFAGDPVSDVRFGTVEGDPSALIEYADVFNGEDVILKVDGADIGTISLLRQFSFRSLELKITFADEEAGRKADVPRSLLFPEATKQVTVTCGGKDLLPDTDAMGCLVASMLVCCPDAVLNGQEVTKWAQLMEAADTYGYFSVYRTGYALHLLYEEAGLGMLEVVPEIPEYYGKLLFLVMGDGELSSAESLTFGEPFYDVPTAYLAADYEEADMAVFLFPEYSLLGVYSNGGEARCTYTRVMAVDLHKNLVYGPYTAVKHDPPEDLPISIENGVYSTAGADGAFAPEEAVQEIVASAEAAAVDLASQAETAAQPGTTAAGTDGAGATEPEGTTAPENAGGTQAAETTAAAGAATAAGETTAPATAVSETSTTAETTAINASEEETSAANEPTAQGETTTTATVGNETTAAAKTNKVLGTGIYQWLDEELLEQILNALDGTIYRETYEALKTSKDLVYGSKGKLALGVQNTLLAFDREIAADSSVGNATLGALNEVQRAFGQELTNRINAPIYAMLMPCLLYYQNPEAAEELLAGIADPAAAEAAVTVNAEASAEVNAEAVPDAAGTDPGQTEAGGLMVYLEACVLYLQDSCYRAKLLFEESRYGDYETRIPYCIQDMPETGEIYRNSSIKGTEAVLHIHVNSQEEAEAVCVRVFTENDELAACLLVRGNGETQTALPPGNYHIMDGSGYRWYGIQDLFGEEGRYSTMIFDDGTDTLRLLAGFDYTITFNVMEHDDAASSIGTQQLEWDGIVSP